MLCCASSLVASADEKKRPATVDALMKVRNVVDLAVAPDGGSVAYVVSVPDAKEGRYNSDIWLVSTKDGKPKQLTAGPKSDDKLAWSPDGKTIACGVMKSPRLADLMEVDLIAVNVEDGKARDLVRRPGVDSTPRFSPDGKQIAFVSHDGKFDWIANPSVCVIPAEGGTPRNVSKGPDEILTWGDSNGMHWSPTARRSS